MNTKRVIFKKHIIGHLNHAVNCTLKEIEGYFEKTNTTFNVDREEVLARFSETKSNIIKIAEKRAKINFTHGFNYEQKVEIEKIFNEYLNRVLFIAKLLNRNNKQSN